MCDLGHGLSIFCKNLKKVIDFTKDAAIMKP